MIDLHSHLLPGLDDGPADVEGSVALAREAAAAGVAVMAATPHLRADFPDVRVEEVETRAEQLRERLREEAIALEIVAGGEVDVLWAQRASDEMLRAASYGGRGTDLLVETPYGPVPEMFEDLLFRIQVRGFRVLLAHPERNGRSSATRRGSSGSSSAACSSSSPPPRWSDRPGPGGCPSG